MKQTREPGGHPTTTQPQPPDQAGSFRTGRVVCYAHRGARAYVPENTLLAFDLAFDVGADAIECDVQRSSDGQLVIIHDGTVNRTTNGAGFVARLSFEELRALDAGRAAHLPQRIPTLDETLALVHRRGGGINLEIKGESLAESVATAEAVGPVLAGLDEVFRARVLVSSFEHPAVRLLKERLPWLRAGALYSTRAWRRRDILAPAIEMGAEAIHPGAGLVTGDLVRCAHDAGLRVNVWTANRWGTIRRLIEWGVDGIFSDYPERVVIVRAIAGGTLLSEE
ncbi:MAG: glycerophosphodiester phosphodiesterase [Ktedonobacterales bacterium]